MKYRNKLVEKIEKFYIDVIEEFKEAELQIMADSKFSSIFRKKDYDGNIRKLRLCKAQALEIEVEKDDADVNEDNTGEVIKRFERCLLIFNKVCDSYIQLQLALKKKAEKKELKFSEYKEIFNKVQDAREQLNDALHELDMVYTDYAYDEDDDDVYEFL